MVDEVRFDDQASGTHLLKLVLGRGGGELLALGGVDRVEVAGGELLGLGGVDLIEVALARRAAAGEDSPRRPAGRRRGVAPRHLNASTSAASFSR